MLVMNEIVFFFFYHVGKDAAEVVVRAQAGGGVKVGTARRVASDARAAAESGNVHGAKSASGRDPAARIVVDVVVVDAKALCEFNP